jgi:hypothetical protein
MAQKKPTATKRKSTKRQSKPTHVYGRAMANWEKEKDYPDPTKASPQCVAWEFLRRNPNYQSQWVSIEETRFTPSDGPARHIWLHRCGQRFGLEFMVKPESRKTPKFVAEEIDAINKHWHWFGGGRIQLEHPSPHRACHMVALPFDLTQPLDKQLARARDFLDRRRRGRIREFGLEWSKQFERKLAEVEHQPRTLINDAVVATEIISLRNIVAELKAPLPTDAKGPKGNYKADKLIGLYRTYLRALDAAAAGCSNSEIAARLFKDKSISAVNDALKAARKLRDVGYRQIAQREIY